MSESSDNRKPNEAANHVAAAAGELSRDVLGQLSRPLRELRQLLAVMVERVDKHISESRGPTPLTWNEVEHFRQQLADAYLLGRSVSRMANEVAEATGSGSSVPEAVDVNKIVESALALTRHRCSADTNVLVDLGSTVFVRAVPGRLMLAIATILTAAANAVFGRDGGRISIETRRKPDSQGAESVVIRIAQQGAGQDASTSVDHGVPRAISSEIGGHFQVEKDSESSVTYILQILAIKQ